MGKDMVVAMEKQGAVAREIQNAVAMNNALQIK